MLQVALDAHVWADTGRPRFVDIVGPNKKWGGDNTDAFYQHAPDRPVPDVSGALLPRGCRVPVPHRLRRTERRSLQRTHRRVGQRPHHRTQPRRLVRVGVEQRTAATATGCRSKPTRCAPSHATTWTTPPSRDERGGRSRLTIRRRRRTTRSRPSPPSSEPRGCSSTSRPASHPCGSIPRTRCRSPTPYRRRPSDGRPATPRMPWGASSSVRTRRCSSTADRPSAPSGTCACGIRSCTRSTTRMGESPSTAPRSSRTTDGWLADRGGCEGSRPSQLGQYRGS